MPNIFQTERKGNKKIINGINIDCKLIYNGSLKYLITFNTAVYFQYSGFLCIVLKKQVTLWQK